MPEQDKGPQASMCVVADTASKREKERERREEERGRITGVDRAMQARDAFCDTVMRDGLQVEG